MSVAKRALYRHLRHPSAPCIVILATQALYLSYAQLNRLLRNQTVCAISSSVK